jgi:hypothetical protein
MKHLPVVVIAPTRLHSVVVVVSPGESRPRRGHLLARDPLDVLAQWPSHVQRLGAAIIALRNLVLNRFALGQRAEPLRVNIGLMDEDVIAAVVGRDEAEALGEVEELDDAALPGGACRRRGQMAEITYDGQHDDDGNDDGSP